MPKPESTESIFAEHGIAFETLATQLRSVGYRLVLIPQMIRPQGSTEGPRVTVVTRLSKQASAELDEWVELGMARSRSEAAASFLMEGLELRRDQLSGLRGALGEYKKAKEGLSRRAASVIEERRGFRS